FLDNRCHFFGIGVVAFTLRPSTSVFLLNDGGHLTKFIDRGVPSFNLVFEVTILAVSWNLVFDVAVLAVSSYSNSSTFKSFGSTKFSIELKISSSSSSLKSILNCRS